MVTVAWDVSVDVEFRAASPMFDMALILSGLEFEGAKTPRSKRTFVSMPQTLTHLFHSFKARFSSSHPISEKTITFKPSSMYLQYFAMVRLLVVYKHKSNAFKCIILPTWQELTCD